MSFFKKISAIALCGIFLAGCATSDPAVKADMDDLRERIAQNGSEEIKKFHANIYDVALSKKWPTAFALIGEDVTIHISAGLRKMLLDLAAVSIVADESSRSFEICRARYAEKLFSQRFNPEYRGMNPRNILTGYDADISIDPGPYFADLNSICAKFASSFPIRASKRKQQEEIARGLLQLIYLHEVGHKTYRLDVPVNYGVQTKEEFRSTLETNRIQELNADRFAVKRWVELHPDPMHVLDNFAFIDWHRAVGGTRCTNDKDRTHDSGEVRALVTIREMRKLTREAGKTKANAPRKARLDKIVKVSARRVSLQNCPSNSQIR
jgi:hypothetical protein